MCRLFGLLTARDEPSEPWLVRTDRSLLAQSNTSPERAQREGWGIAWYENGGRTHVVKGVGGAFEPHEREVFVRTANTARPPLVIGHLRHASNPLELPYAKLIGLENSQPFHTHSVLFAHNGSIPFPRETRPMLGVHEGQVVGVNDSEVLFWLLQRNIEETDNPLVGYLRTVEDLVRVWQGLKRPAVPPFSGLNVLYSRGPDELWAFCLWTGDHGTGLIDTSRRYYEMTYRSTPTSVVVGSEPFDEERGAWRPMASGTYLHAQRSAGRVDLKVAPIPIPAALEVRPLPA
jgi:predicted glutamine amidotransferase